MDTGRVEAQGSNARDFPRPALFYLGSDSALETSGSRQYMSISFGFCLLFDSKMMTLMDDPTTNQCACLTAKRFRQILMQHAHHRRTSSVVSLARYQLPDSRS